MVVVQAWILLTSAEALRLGFLKVALRQDVRERAHDSCGSIARWILNTFFDGFQVEGMAKAQAALAAAAAAAAVGGGDNGDDNSDDHDNDGGSKKGGPAVVIVANHQSMMDVEAIFTLRLLAAWVAKTTGFYIPGVGTLMALAGCE